MVEAAIEFTDPTYSPRFAQFPLKRVWPDMFSVLKAQHIRRRFTMLDLVLRTHALPIFGDDNKGAE